MDLHNHRLNYSQDSLSEDQLPNDPIELFGSWMHDALQGGTLEANAMSLATSTLDGRPSVRVVLLKKFDHRGFVFYTNYKSHKGQDLNQNPHVAFTMWWPPLQRQVRVEGYATHVAEEESISYFNSRPVGSRLGAIVSPQSEVIDSRDVLENRLAEMRSTSRLDKPKHWGGYRIRPERIEFWQGRDSRLHDRLVYQLSEDRSWSVYRLAP